MKNDRYTLSGLSAEAGSITRDWLRFLELNDGTFLELPTVVVNGSHKGDTVYIGAGVHGDEINMVLALVDALEKIDPAHVHGTVVAVTIENPYGYLHRRRLFDFNQSDSETLNLHRVFPGSSTGDLHQRMAHRLYQLMKDSGANFIFDLHTGTTGSYCPPHTFVAADSAGSASSEAFEAAKAFNAGMVVSTGEGVYAHPTMPHTILAAEGVPVLGTELGQGGYVDEALVELGANGILNVLRHRGVLVDGADAELIDQTVITDVHYVRSNRGGLLTHLVSPGDRVGKGQPIARISNLFGDTVETVLAPFDSFVVNSATNPTIHEGERIVRLGT